MAIVGAGLTGLALARQLHAARVPFRLFEARNRLGGRIKTEHVGAGGFDLGPSWFWPGQPRMAGLVQTLGLATFEQYATGTLLYQSAQGEVIRNRGVSPMQGALRVAGGMGAIVSGLFSGVPETCVEIGQAVVSVSGEGVLGFADRADFSAGKVVLAMPPRVVRNLTFRPALTPDVHAALGAIPTWMAGHAKVVAIYERPFWRANGLSGDAMSQRGPMVEIHDASVDGWGALFGFLGVPAASRVGQDPAIVQACVTQFEQLFGPDAGSPVELFYTDWAQDPQTATDLDQQPLMHHPAYGRPKPLRTPVGERVFVTSTELAPEMGGFLEGALAAADEAAQWVLSG